MLPNLETWPRKSTRESPGNLASIEAPVFKHLGSFAAPGVATVTGPVEFYDDSCMRTLGVVGKVVEKVVEKWYIYRIYRIDWWLSDEAELALPDARVSTRIGQPCGGLPFYRLKMGDVRSCAEFCTWVAYMRKNEAFLKVKSFIDRAEEVFFLAWWNWARSFRT